MQEATSLAPIAGVLDSISSNPANQFDILSELENTRTVLKVDEVAALFRVSKFTIYRMAEKNEIPSMLIGGSRRFNPKTLGYWLRKKDPMLALASRSA